VTHLTRSFDFDVIVDEFCLKRQQLFPLSLRDFSGRLSRDKGGSDQCYKSVTLGGRPAIQVLQEHSVSDRQYSCYKSVTLIVRPAIHVLQNCHTRCQTGRTSVIKVSHSVSDRQYKCYKSVALGVRAAVQVLQKCHTRCRMADQGYSNVTQTAYSSLDKLQGSIHLVCSYSLLCSLLNRKT
jgi:hypothetical protein